MEQLTKNGIILKGVGGLYTVRLLSRESEPALQTVQCRARGSFRHDGITPLPGDRVTLLSEQASAFADKNSEAGNWVIDALEERSCALIRPALANLGYLFVTMAAAAPTPILATVDKMIAIAEFNKIEPVVVITKSDLNPSYAQELAKLYRLCGFSCFCVSSQQKEGLEPLRAFIREHIPGKIAAFAGASGVGKSTLMNHLFGSLNLSTSEISRKIERGRHTTRQVELFPLSSDPDCGYVADTPGFSMLDFERFHFFDKEDLPETMREFVPFLGGCRYTKCSHTKEEGCAVLQAVRDGHVPASRHASYVELYDVLKNKKKWT